MKWRSLKLLGCLSIIALGLSGNTQNNYYVRINSSLENYSQSQLYQIAQSITVKIFAEGKAIGSGIIVQNQDNNYTILTNAHVLQVLEPPYQVQTSDNKIHDAKIIQSANFNKIDLALLQFRATDISYTVAKFGSSYQLIQGEQVFVSGFPFISYGSDSQSNFTFNSGKIVFILKKALEGGYQVGYTNTIEKGMSGGPLLDKAGKVVGINGMHAYPLWESLTYYEDGTEPPPDLQQLITDSSWAIPIEKLKQSAPNLQFTF